MSTAFVYVVVRRDYDDYWVMGVCGTQEQAELIATNYNLNLAGRGDAVVEKLPILEHDTVEPVSILRMSTIIWNNGTEALPATRARYWPNTDEEVTVTWPFEAVWGAYGVDWLWVRAPVHKGRGGRLEVHGTNHKKVREVFAEKRAWLMSDASARKEQRIEGEA